jgi:hypothetical protein
MVEVINLSTCKDWGKPGDILIDRRTKWGNPFIMQNESQRDEVCNKYELWLNDKLKQKIFNLEDLRSAKRLGCHCSPLRCHGDHLKNLLDKPIPIQQSLNL